MIHTKIISERLRKLHKQMPTQMTYKVNGAILHRTDVWLWMEEDVWDSLTHEQKQERMNLANILWKMVVK